MFKTIRGLANLLKLARSMENPKTNLSDPDDWLWTALGAGKTKSGVAVNSNTALTYSPVWRAVALLSKDVAKLPLLLYKRQGEGKARATEHPAFKLLRRKPNASQTAFTFKGLLMTHALLHGNGYAYISRRGDATPVELLPLLPENTHAERRNGQLLYVTRIRDDQVTLRGEDVLHVRGLSIDGLMGLNTTSKARDAFGLGMAAEEFNARYFGNSAEPSGVLEHPKRLTKEAQENLKATWNQKHQGLSESHRLAVLEEGMTYKAIGADARKAQLLELRKFSILDVANYFGIPPHKLGYTDRASYASLEQENQSYLDDALDPWLTCIEEECREKLLTEQEKDDDTHSVEFLRQAVVRTNLTARAQFYNMGLQGGWLNRDEIRGFENLNPIPDGEGQKFLVPLNMTPAGTEPTADAPHTDPAADPQTDPQTDPNDGSHDGKTNSQRRRRKR